MTVDLTDAQVEYLQEYLTEMLQENLDLDEYEMVIDLSDKLTQRPEELDFLAEYNDF